MWVHIQSRNGPVWLKQEDKGRKATMRDAVFRVYKEYPERSRQEQCNKKYIKTRSCECSAAVFLQNALEEKEEKGKASDGNKKKKGGIIFS